VSARPPIDPAFSSTLRVLASARVHHAEAWRQLIPVAERIRKPRPSYPTVRRHLRREQLRAERRAEAVERVLGSLLQGRVPSVWALEELRQALVP
jgi:hypothetical protein